MPRLRRGLPTRKPEQLGELTVHTLSVALEGVPVWPTLGGRNHFFPVSHITSPPVLLVADKAQALD